MDTNDKFNDVVFGKTKITDLYKEIHTRANKQESLIMDAIDQLKDLISTPTDAQIVVPLIKEYMGLALKTNEHLIKMVDIIQKASDRVKKGEPDLFSSEEKKDLDLLYQEYFKKSDQNASA